MNARQARVGTQRELGVYADSIFGPKTRAAFDALAVAPDDAEWPPAQASGRILSAPGWAFTARVDGEDIVVNDCRATCFGGADDPQDSGETASGISTKADPGIKGVALPMDFGDAVPNTRGSPIPRVPWRTLVAVTSGGRTYSFPVIDTGPAKKTGNGLDLTIAAARLFDPAATARSFEMRCTYKIIGGAQYATP